MNSKIVVGTGGMGLAIALFGLGVVLSDTFTWRVCPQTTYAKTEIMDVEATTYFSSSYQTARERFIEAARAGGGSIESFENPRTGPESQPLFTDVALIGSKGAKTILVLSSGTHGVEGFAGSGVQTGLLREGVASRLASGVSLVMIHAINPYGMAHLRRFTEDNVDLNRNFRDHSQTYPSNPGYEKLAVAIAPRSLSFWSEVGSWGKLLWFRATAGKTASQAAVQGGQYSHPTGLFYGGTFDTWSNRAMRSIAHLDASLKLAFTDMLPNAEVTAVSLEFGTVPPMEVFKALRAENWLHHHGGPDHPRAREIKTSLLRAFHPADVEWEAQVWRLRLPLCAMMGDNSLPPRLSIDARS